ncbi:putative transmembrane zinc-binding protein [Prevotella sp. CAG:604]|nr:putative transmembrane zinc-binding protein [Prevotella sp. CAG:604]
MSRIPNTFVTLQKKTKISYMIRLNSLHISRLKWRHWVLLVLLSLITLTKLIPLWGFIYTTRIYPIIGSLLSPISGLFPFAVGDIFIALSIVWVIFYPIYEIKWRKQLAKRFFFLAAKRGCYPKKKVVFGRVAEYLLWVYAWFYIAWGLNYSQPNIYCRTGMKPAEVSEAKFREFAYRYADSINYLSEERRVKSEETAFDDQRESQFNGMVDDGLKNRVRDAVLKGYNEIGAKEGINAPFNQHPHAKTMLFTPLSSMSGVTGSMGPFFCEFTLNGDIRPHDYPAIYAHEFAHLLGIANEGEANFYSYIVCTASSDKAVKFSGYYHIFFHVLRNVFDILGEKEGEKFLKYIRPEIIQLAKSDRNYWLSKRCKVLDAAQDFIFDLYLRGNHVAEGRKSYSGVVGLILAWESRHAKRPFDG